jgi:hypothetical protein
MSTRMSALGNGLVISGAAVAVATVGASAAGYEIVLTPAMVHLLVYKGLAAAAVGLIVVGSWLGRHGRQQESRTKTSEALLTPGIPSFPYEQGFERPYEEATTKHTKDTKKTSI